jgi:hypothetical protein
LFEILYRYLQFSTFTPENGKKLLVCDFGFNSNILFLWEQVKEETKDSLLEHPEVLPKQIQIKVKEWNVLN